MAFLKQQRETKIKCFLRFLPPYLVAVSIRLGRSLEGKTLHFDPPGGCSEQRKETFKLSELKNKMSYLVLRFVWFERFVRLV